MHDCCDSGHQACSVEEYVSGENSLPTCREMDDENWEDAFLEDLCREPVKGTMQDKEDDEGSDEIELAPKINTYKEVNEYLEEVQHFLESRGHAMEAFKIGSIMDDVSCIQINAARQTALDSWLVSSQ